VPKKAEFRLITIRFINSIFWLLTSAQTKLFRVIVSFNGIWSGGANIPRCLQWGAPAQLWLSFHSALLSFDNETLHNLSWYDKYQSYFQYPLQSMIHSTKFELPGYETSKRWFCDDIQNQSLWHLQIIWRNLYWRLDNIILFVSTSLEPILVLIFDRKKAKIISKVNNYLIIKNKHMSIIWLLKLCKARSGLLSYYYTSELPKSNSSKHRKRIYSS
jgi:hypothetical protein